MAYRYARIRVLIPVPEAADVAVTVLVPYRDDARSAGGRLGGASDLIHFSTTATAWVFSMRASEKKRPTKLQSSGSNPASDGRLQLRLAMPRGRALCSGLARRLNSFSYT